MTRVLLLDENRGNTCTCIYTVCHCRCDSCVVTRREPGEYMYMYIYCLLLLDENQGNTCTCIYTVCHCRCDSCVVTRREPGEYMYMYIYCLSLQM